jgi:EamA-like transporter family protein
MLLGLVLGLIAAVGQSASYVFSRLFVVKRKQGVFRLLVLGHVLMGAVCATALPLLWPESLPPAGDFLGPLLAASGFYLVGQTGLFLALQTSDASRVSPLLALKIVVLALIGVSLLGQSLGGLQWLAVSVAVFGAWMLRDTGGRLPARTLGAVGMACLGYSLSDLNIEALVLSFPGLSLLRATLLSVALCYSLLGAAALGLLPRARPSRKALAYAAPWAACWLGAMVALFACFATGGVVFGNIVQSTRGILSVVLGALLAKAGLFHIERERTAGTVLRQLLAAALMALAIALYLIDNTRG